MAMEMMMTMNVVAMASVAAAQLQGMVKEMCFLWTKICFGGTLLL
jgi:hypothetical protein